MTTSNESSLMRSGKLSVWFVMKSLGGDGGKTYQDTTFLLSGRRRNPNPVIWTRRAETVQARVLARHHGPRRSHAWPERDRANIKGQLCDIRAHKIHTGG
ncbi:hypothetical protein HerbRD11066_77410 [Herbidospora sp. RD11066]